MASHGALLIVDMINPLDFPGARSLLAQAQPITKPLANLRRKFKRHNLPVVYVNDNFANWQEDIHTLIARVRQPDCPGRKLLYGLLPEAGDYLVLKPKHSAFFETPLPSLLEKLGNPPIFLAGIAADACVLQTALDAKVRNIEACVLSDCVAAQSKEATAQALALLRRWKIAVRSSQRIAVS